MSENQNDDKTQSSTPLIKDTIVGQYRIIEKIGAGGMGEVYLAEDTRLNRKVALKFLPLHLCQDEDCRKRFIREAQAAAALDHPNIAAIYEVGDYQNRPFYAMQVVEGQSLKEVIAGKDLSIDRILEIAIQICEGLQAAHDKGIIHRDIKPSNILIDNQGRIRIIDFGLAQVKDSENLTKTGSTLGTIGYMSPEQVQGNEVDFRSDLFSLGIVIYEMITGRLPFKADTEAATFNSILNKTPEPLSRYKSDVPELMQQIINKLLEKKPDHRYQSAEGVLSDLKRLSSTTPSTKVVDQWNRYVVPSAVIVLLIMAAYWWFVWRDKIPANNTNKEITLAVLPFENLGNPDDEYFADGITDEIASRLSAVKNLRIIGRRSVLEYKGTNKSIQEIGKELGVDYILDGTVRWQNPGTDDSRVRVTPQLLRVSDASSVWSDIYDDAITQIFTVQSTIASKVVNSLNIALGTPEKMALERAPTRDLQAYDYYLRAIEYYNSYTGEEEIKRAIALLRKAVEIDSTFLNAWVELSYILSFYHWNGFDPGGKMVKPAKEAADMAVKFDSLDAYSHLALGYYAYYCEYDLNKALKEFKYTAERMSNNANAISAIGYVQRRLGHWDKALEYQSRGLKLDPLIAWNYNDIALSARYMRRFDIAEEWLAKGLTLFPDFQPIIMEKVRLQIAETGDPRAALEIIDNFSKAVKEHWMLDDLIMEFAYWAGEYDRALDASVKFSKHLETPIDTIMYLYRMGDIYKAMGDSAKNKQYYKSAADFVMAKLRSKASLYQGGTFPVGPVLGEVYDKNTALKYAREYAAELPVSKDALYGANMLTSLSIAYARLDEPDSALVLIDSLLSIPSMLTIPRLKSDPDFKALHNQPGFEAIINKYKDNYGDNL
jgi:serine/threonine protein kinase/tetratricopeptide (TPR) repeat protein